MTWNLNVLTGLNDAYLRVITIFSRFLQERDAVQHERLEKMWKKRIGDDIVSFHVCLRFLKDLFCQGTSLPQKLCPQIVWTQKIRLTVFI